jgi:phage gpG-like protein
MTFTSDLAQFAATVEQRSQAVFVATVVEMRDSIKYGSALTGAPSMPVAPGKFKRSGALRDSVTVSYSDPNTAVIYTTSPYALDVEDNAKGHQFNSGGPHGWKLTAAAFERIVATVTARLSGYRA